MNSSKYLLIDSNILVYAINSRSPKHKTAQNFLQANIGELVVAHQNILETLRVLTHTKFPSPLSVPKAIEEIKNITDVCYIISPDYKTHHIALELIKEHGLSSNKIFDAYLTATALSNHITHIATDNEKDFRQFSITIYNPFTAN